MSNNNSISRTALITGATSGIGFEFARILRRAGWHLVLVSRSLDRLTQANQILSEGKGTVTLVPCDLSSESASNDLYDRCRKENIRVDVLINNAGVGYFGEHANASEEKIRRLTILNIVSLTTLCNLFGSDMKQRKRGYILNVASTAAYQPIPYFAAYAASKSYVRSFSLAFSQEMQPHNVYVTCLCPGPTDTHFFEEAGIGNEMSGFFGLKSRMSARAVAEAGIRGLFQRKRMVIPGLRNKFLAFFGTITPRSILLATLAKILGKNSSLS